MTAMRVLLTVAAVVLNIGSIGLVLLTIAQIKLDQGGQIACLVFVGVLILNMVAIQFGARFEPKKARSDDTVSTFD